MRNSISSRRPLSRRRLGSVMILAASGSTALAGAPAVDRADFDGSLSPSGPEALRSWNVPSAGSGTWSTPGNWAPVGIPTPGDDVRLIQSDAVNRTVTYDSPGGSTLNSVRLDSTGPGLMSMQQGFHQLTTNELVVGLFGSASYTLTGGTLTTGETYVAPINTGSFTQNGGRHVASMFLSIGNNAGSLGRYNLNSGIVSVGELDVGYFGAGELFHLGGSMTASQFYGVGVATLGTGTYVMSGSSTLFAPAGYVGLYGAGTFLQTGGTHSVVNNVSVGEAPGSTGFYGMFGGNLNATELSIGYEGVGTLAMSGGNVSVGTFFVAAQPSSAGGGTLSAGTLAVGNESIIGAGTNSTASFLQTGGVHQVGTDLSVAFFPGSVASYTLQDGSLSSAKLKVGYIGNGTFTQLGGVQNVTTYVSIADQAASTSSYAMRGGTLNADELEVGYRGNGFMTHDGGTINVASFTAVGFVTSGTGRYALLPGGTLNSANTYVGLYGTGTFAQSGGLHSVPGVLSVGENTGAAGTYTLGSTGRIVAGELDVGFQGVGVMSQNGGTISATELNVGASTGGVGSYDLTAGVLAVGDENLAWTAGSVGTFTQSGGVHTVANTLNLTFQPMTTAAFTLNGGSLSAGSLNVGGGSLAPGGSAVYTQGGGTLTVANRVRVYNTGSLSLNGGSFSVGTLDLSAGGRMTVGAGADLTPRVQAIVASSGTLNLNDNALIVDYTGSSPMGLPTGPVGSVANLLSTGYAGGLWNGPGINSGVGNPSVFALGYAEASYLYGISGSGTATFRGQTVDATSVLVLLTYYGDATLNRRVDISDFAQLGANFNATNRTWQHGDFNYNGTVEIGDFALMAANWNLAFPGARPAPVPEPSAFALAGAATALVLGRRRRR